MTVDKLILLIKFSRPKSMDTTNILMIKIFVYSDQFIQLSRIANGMYTMDKQISVSAIHQPC